MNVVLNRDKLNIAKESKEAGEAKETAVDSKNNLSDKIAKKNEKKKQNKQNKQNSKLPHLKKEDSGETYRPFEMWMKKKQNNIN